MDSMFVALRHRCGQVAFYASRAAVQSRRLAPADVINPDGSEPKPTPEDPRMRCGSCGTLFTGPWLSNVTLDPGEWTREELRGGKPAKAAAHP